MKTLKTLLALCLVLGAARPALAQSSAGAESFDFLLLDANARPVAMAGAYTALATDANALQYNPAGLGSVTSHEATFMHNQYLQGLTQEYLAYVSPLGWSVNVNYLSFGSIERTTFANKSNSGSSFGINDLAVAGGYGRKLGDNFGLGGSLKIIREQIDDVSGTGFALDGGALYAVPQVKGLSLGLSLQNLGPDVKFQQRKEKLPLNVRLGAAYALPWLGAMHTFALDVTKERTDKTRVAFVAESVIGKVKAVRFGFNSANNAGIGLTGGVGWLWNNASIDYAIVPFDALGIAHRISLSYRWGTGAGSKTASSGKSSPY